MMNKAEFFSVLRNRLSVLSKDERDAAISYYEEFFEEAGEENEKAVISELGGPKALAEKILSEINGNESNIYSEKAAAVPPAPKVDNPNEEAKSSESGDNTLFIITIIALVLTSFIWVPLVASILTAILAIILSLFLVTAIFLFVGISLIIAGVVKVFTAAIAGSILIFTGLILTALGLLLLIPCVLTCTKLIPAIFKGIASLFRKLFQKRQVA